MSDAPTWWTPSRVAALEAEANRWRGTPFAPNSCARGLGVSCQKLTGALYEAAGYPPVYIPDVPISHARFSDRSFVTEFFADRPDFQLLTAAEPITAGDILGFRLGRCIHHLGIALNGHRFIHAIDGAGVCIAHTQDATWLSRLVCIWRPRP
jgi:cell wall-associated NlpC family hydrolase